MRALLFALGLTTGALGGAIGIGGGIVLAPLLLFLPQHVGLEQLDIRTVAALTLVQSLAACLAGTLVHRKLQHVHTRLAVVMGSTVAVSSFIAALVSRHVSNAHLSALFVAVVVLASLLMVLPNPSADRDVAVAAIDAPPGQAALIAAVVGVLGGLVGQGGSFLVAPAMLYLLRLPTRVTIGTSLAVSLCAAAAGLAGKALSGQLELAMAAPIGAGAMIGSSLGALASRRLPARALRLSLAIVLWGTALRITTAGT